uniref:Uncharacterized protein n=1 Tax=Rhizophora mucronata TaxID=61149 RepID=A0A2P2PTG0_RHIMU
MHLLQKVNHVIEIEVSSCPTCK